MTALCKKFARLLMIELESLEEELEILVQTLERRHAAHEITDYVHNENWALLRNEILGVRDFLQSGCSVDSDEVRTPDDAAAVVRSVVKYRLEERGYAPALLPLIESRIAKVALYLKLENAPL